MSLISRQLYSLNGIWQAKLQHVKVFSSTIRQFPKIVCLPPTVSVPSEFGVNAKTVPSPVNAMGMQSVMFSCLLGVNGRGFTVSESQTLNELIGD